jgi:riboflavin kinase/FMN adenylyltransferase
VRAALAAGDMAAAAALLGRPYSVSGRVVHGKRLGRVLGESGAGRGDGFRTLNVRFPHPKPAAMGIFVVRVHGLAAAPVAGVASLGKRPTIDDSGRVLLEVHCLDWPAALGVEGGYGKLVRVELLHKLRDEARYDSLAALAAAIGQDARDARVFLDAEAAAHAATGRQTTRDRI